MKETQGDAKIGMNFQESYIEAKKKIMRFEKNFTLEPRFMDNDLMYIQNGYLAFEILDGKKDRIGILIVNVKKAMVLRPFILRPKRVHDQKNLLPANDQENQYCLSENRYLIWEDVFFSGNAKGDDVEIQVNFKSRKPNKLINYRLSDLDKLVASSEEDNAWVDV